MLLVKRNPNRLIHLEQDHELDEQERYLKKEDKKLAMLNVSDHLFIVISREILLDYYIKFLQNQIYIVL